MLLGGLTTERFLERHWQKRPLLVRGAIADHALPTSRDEITALACRSGINARLIVGSEIAEDWSVRSGPFTPEDLDALPGHGWTVLVQEVDRHLPVFAELLDRFRFVPNWRIDDVMVSYAADGGGVGPHIDRYDVFLLQAAGRRRWRITSTPVTDESLVPGVELPLLANFEPDEEWLLEPGDLLYLPPRLGHDGVADGECVTCSIGFRVPDPRELCARYITQLSPQAFDAIRYADPDLQKPEHLGEIPAAARRRLRESVQRLFADESEFDRWVGRFVTAPLRGAPSGPVELITPSEIRSRLAGGAVLTRSAPAHFAWQRDDDGTVRLFVGGEDYPLGRGQETFAELLCGRELLDEAALAPHPNHEAILVDLLLRGFLRGIPSG